MKIFIHGHREYLATLEIDYPMEQVQERVWFHLNQDKTPDGPPRTDLTDKSAPTYLALEYELAGYMAHDKMPMYQFRRTLEGNGNWIAKPLPQVKGLQ